MDENTRGTGIDPAAAPSGVVTEPAREASEDLRDTEPTDGDRQPAKVADEDDGHPLPGDVDEKPVVADVDESAAGLLGRLPIWARSMLWPLTAFVIGVLLALFAITDASGPGNFVALVLAIGAHATVPVFLRRIADGVTGRPGEDGTVPRGRVWRSTVGLCFWVAVLWNLDQWVWRLPIALWARVTYRILAATVIVVVAVLEVISFRSDPGRPSRRSQRADPTSWLAKQWRRISDRIPQLVVGIVVGSAAVVLVIAVAAFLNQRDIDEDDIDVPAALALDSATPVYVALGDSYSAGEGLQDRVPSPQTHCHRSPDAYPVLLARALAGITDDGTLTDYQLWDRSRDLPIEFRACSGAVTADVDSALIGGWDPQLDPEPRNDVGLVTLTIGGNDVIFSDVVQACMLYENCLTEDFEPRDLDPNRPSIDYPEAQPLEDWAQAALTTNLRPNLERVYENVRNTYPKARIVIIGYPHLVHPYSAWDSFPDLDCMTVMNRISQHERRGLRTLTDDLNETIRAVIADHPDWQLEMISTTAAWNGHEPCGERGQYTNSVKPALELLNPVDGGTFHPNEQGHRQIARILSCYLHAVTERPAADQPITAIPGTASLADFAVTDVPACAELSPHPASTPSG